MERNLRNTHETNKAIEDRKVLLANEVFASSELLASILPESVIDKFQTGFTLQAAIAERIDCATVLVWFCANIKCLTITVCSCLRF